MSGEEEPGNHKDALPPPPLASSETPPQGTPVQRKQTLLGVGLQAVAKEPIPKEPIPKEPIPKEPIPKEPISKEPEGTDEPPLLPETKTEYAAPRALPAAQRGADLGPETTIEVAATARVSSVVREAQEESIPDSLAEDRAASARLDTLPPRARVPAGRGRFIAIAAIVTAGVIIASAALVRFASGTGRVVSGSSPVPSHETKVTPPPTPDPTVTEATVDPPAPTVEEQAAPAAPPVAAQALDELPQAAETEEEGAPAPVPEPPPAPRRTAPLPKSEATAATKTPHKAPATHSSPPKSGGSGSIVRESPF